MKQEINLLKFMEILSIKSFQIKIKVNINQDVKDQNNKNQIELKRKNFNNNWKKCYQEMNRMRKFSCFNRKIKEIKINYMK